MAILFLAVAKTAIFSCKHSRGLGTVRGLFVCFDPHFLAFSNREKGEREGWGGGGIHTYTT